MPNKCGLYAFKFVILSTLFIPHGFFLATFYRNKYFFTRMFFNRSFASKITSPPLIAYLSHIHIESIFWLKTYSVVLKKYSIFLSLREVRVWIILQRREEFFCSGSCNNNAIHTFWPHTIQLSLQHICTTSSFNQFILSWDGIGYYCVLFTLQLSFAMLPLWK